MLVSHLRHQEFLDLEPERGTLRFAGERALILDAVAIGQLRKSLIETIGRDTARTLLTQFGFAHGWRRAGAVQRAFKWESEDQRNLTSFSLSALEGLFYVQPKPNADAAPGEVTLLGSYEAEQHLLHFGLADEPVCWTIAGIISGHLSRISGMDVHILEDRCTAHGADTCHFVPCAPEQLNAAPYPAQGSVEPSRIRRCLNASAHQIVEALKAVERKLKEPCAQRNGRSPAPHPQLESPRIGAQSDAMQRLLKLVHRVAVTDSTILITGESGVGKERIARLIHDASPRAEGPYIAVNCGAISESLLESELFGHASGSFTGATHGRVGLFEAANHGTLLLDEISEIPLEMQVKLLRVIQEREVRRVGENHNRHIDVRILAATNGDLAREVACGNFRRDLYYRLNVVDLHMPPLRDRQADILPLAQHLLACAAQRLNRDIKGLAPDAADRLLNYGWPGNVRELENAMERAAVFAAGPRVQCEDLPAEIRSAIHPMARNVDGGMPTLKDVERQYILTTLETNNGNQRQTAQDLQIGSATLYRKLKQYGASANFGNQNGNWPASYQESQ